MSKHKHAYQVKVVVVDGKKYRVKVCMLCGNYGSEYERVYS